MKYLFPLAFIFYFSLSGCKGDGEGTEVGAIVTSDTIITTDNYNGVREVWRTRFNKKILALEKEISRKDKEMENASESALANWKFTKDQMRTEMDKLKRRSELANDKAAEEWDTFQIKLNTGIDTLRAQFGRAIDDDGDGVVEFKLP